MNPPDFRALCAELFEAWRNGVDLTDPMNDAYDILAKSFVEGPAAGASVRVVSDDFPADSVDVDRILRLAEIIRKVDGGNRLGAAALAEAILAHWAQPGAEGPTDEAIDRVVSQAISTYIESDTESLVVNERRLYRVMARAILARWGQRPAVAPVPEAELPPRPPLATAVERLDLVRYGVTWDGSPDKPLLTPKPDGYWTPWHIAARLPQPVPVSERLPERADCTPWPGEPDSDPWCWAGRSVSGGWEWAQLGICFGSYLGRVMRGHGYSHWLPHWALPLPATPAAEEVQP